MASPTEQSWQTKPTDRFILKWIKLHLSVKITRRLASYPQIAPWMVTVFSAALGTLAGAVFALGWGWPAGLGAAASQVLDGVDGQLARLTGRQTRFGAFLDSVLDRYPDGAMVIGLTVYLVRTPIDVAAPLVGFVGALALIGCGLISYAKARAETLHFDLGNPTLASKGTRMTAMAAAGLLSPFGPEIPWIVLVYLAVHSNAVVIRYLYRVKTKPSV